MTPKKRSKKVDFVSLKAKKYFRYISLNILTFIYKSETLPNYLEYDFFKNKNLLRINRPSRFLYIPNNFTISVFGYKDFVYQYIAYSFSFFVSCFFPHF